MHTKPIPEYEGELSLPSAAPSVACRRCGATNVTHQTWESNDGAYEDSKCTCTSCGHFWWIDGPDA